MKRALPVITAVALIAFAPSCTTSKQQTQQAVVATTSALVALPLIPVAIPVTASREAHESKVEKHWEAVLDPVYEKRIALIQERDPIADARQAWTNGARAFLPSGPCGDIFPGLEGTEYHLNKQFAPENYTQILHNEFLRYLETLMGKDPVQLQNEKIIYYNNTWKQFIDVCWKYRESFNKEMYRRQMSSKKS